MFKKVATLNADYYHKLEAWIADEGVDDLWKAFDEADNKKERETIRSLYEAFDDEHHAEYFEEGSTLPNLNGQEMVYCACSEESDYKKTIEGWTLGTIPGHPFSDICACESTTGYCKGFMSVDVLGLNWVHLGSSKLVPRGKPGNCYGETEGLRLKFWGLTIVALFIAIFAYRSTSGILTDFHRMNLWNIICTWIFVFMYMIDDPHLGGYNRFLGAGIFVHNAAEWNFMLRLWFGNNLRSRQTTAWWGFMFLTIMMLLIVLLPLQTQLVLAGTLGAMLDVTFLLASFPMIIMAKRSEDEDEDFSFWSKESWLNTTLRVGESRFTGILFLFAFISHVVALQSIFGAMSDGDLTVEVWITTLITTFFQFILLEMFAYNQDQRAVWCMPYDESSFYMVESEKQDNLYTLVDNTNATSTANAGMLVKTILDGELDSNPEVKRGSPDRKVYDNSVYRDGLDERLRGCPECTRCLPWLKACGKPEDGREDVPCCAGLVRISCSPFIVYLFIGFVVALLVNLNLFVFKPEAIDVDTLNTGDCPGYYPLHGNGGVPGWIDHMHADHPFRLKYGNRFWVKVEDGLNVLAVIGSIILFVLLLTLIMIQKKTMLKRDQIDYSPNLFHKRNLVSEKTETQRGSVPVATAHQIELAEARNLAV